MPQITDQPTALGASNGAVTENHFGSNFLFDQDEATQGSNYDVITDITNVQTLRFPGGTLTESSFDPTNANDLADLEQFLGYSNSNGHSAVIVLPTERYFSASSTNFIDPAAEAEIQDYVRHVLDRAAANGVTVQGFETGNEFFQNFGTGQSEWTASEFGYLQAQMAEWIFEEIGESADIYIQSGRTADDNDAMVNAYTAVDPSGVDGIITHLYYAPTGGDLTRIAGVQNRLELLNDAWGSFDLSTIVTEWNTSEANGYGGNSAVYGLARLAALTRGFGDMIGNGVDSAMIWSTIAGGPNGRSTLGQTDSNDALYMLPTGYWYQLLATTLIDTNLVSDFGFDAAFYDDANSFAGYSYIFQGTGSENNDYHILYASGVDDTLDITLDLSNLISSASYVYASVIRNTGATLADDPHADAQLEIHTDLNSLEDFSLEAYEFLQVNIVTGHGVTFDTDLFHDVADDLDLTQYADTVRTFGGNDTVHGEGGNDEIVLGSGNDLAFGGTGNDVLSGSEGNDNLQGDAGFDELWGGTGNDTLSGGAGGDVLGGFVGNDVLYGGTGADELWGGEGSDTLNGGSGNDTIGAFNGNDVLNGDDGNDELWGSVGNDSLNGGTGDDTLGGGAGDDTLSGGSGIDQIYGGAGADTFVFGRFFESVLVSDFNLGHGDRLRLNDNLWSGNLTMAQVVNQFGSINAQGDFQLSFFNGETLILDGVLSSAGLAGQIDFF